jgi:UDP-glucose 4-epimerase
MINKNILITGGLGHIGSLLIPFLLNKGFNLIVLDDLSTQRYCSLFNLPKKGKFRFINADVKTFNFNTIKNKIDVIVNLAALTDAANSFKNKNKLFENNYNITKVITNFAEKNNKKLMAFSSTSVYGTQLNLVDENCDKQELKPQSPYAECKLKEERFLRKRKNLKYIIFRFGTIFGTSSGMRFHTAVNKFCWQSAHNEILTVWKTAIDQKRPYLDIDDAVNAIYLTLKKDLFNNEIYNILTFNKTVREIIDCIKKINKNTKFKLQNNEIMNQLSYEVCNLKSIRSGFRYKGNLESKIKKTLKLFKNNY